jgi:hypothetical protein
MPFMNARHLAPRSLGFFYDILAWRDRHRNLGAKMLSAAAVPGMPVDARSPSQFVSQIAENGPVERARSSARRNLSPGARDPIVKELARTYLT